MALEMGNGYKGIGLNNFGTDVDLLESFLIDGDRRLAFAS
jgi:hypothetical protein